jgi:hypothetical protein
MMTNQENDIVGRIDLAIERVTSGQGQMRIPADPTDPDLVLLAAKDEINSLRAKVKELEAEVSKWKALSDAQLLILETQKRREDRAKRLSSIKASQDKPVAWTHPRYFESADFLSGQTGYMWGRQVASDYVPLYLRPSPTPQGWKLVPIEPTDDMVYSSVDAGRIDPDEVEAIWEAMLSASPAAPK